MSWRIKWSKVIICLRSSSLMLKLSSWMKPNQFEFSSDWGSSLEMYALSHCLLLQLLEYFPTYKCFWQNIRNIGSEDKLKRSIFRRFWRKTSLELTAKIKLQKCLKTHVIKFMLVYQGCKFFDSIILRVKPTCRPLLIYLQEPTNGIGF